MNIDANFVQPDETISHHDMHDYLNLTQKGYDKAFEPVNDLLIQLLSESETDHVRTEAEGAAEWILIKEIIIKYLAFFKITHNDKKVNFKRPSQPAKTKRPRAIIVFLFSFLLY